MSIFWNNLSIFQQVLLVIAVGIGVLMPQIVLLYLDFKNPNKEQRVACFIQYLGWSVALLLWWCHGNNWISVPEAGLFYVLFIAVGLAVTFDQKRRKTLSELESRLALMEQTIEKPRQAHSTSSGT
jgi:branched-subunit amino acid transport protein AzlD